MFLCLLHLVWKDPLVLCLFCVFHIPSINCCCAVAQWFEISAPPVPPSQLSYDEYTDCTVSVGRLDGEGEDWPRPSYAEAKKMKSLTLHTHGCPRASLRDWSSSMNRFLVFLQQVFWIWSFLCYIKLTTLGRSLWLTRILHSVLSAKMEQSEQYRCDESPTKEN